MDCAEGIEQLYEEYLKVGLTLEEFEGQKYKRIAHVKYLIAEAFWMRTCVERRH